MKPETAGKPDLNAIAIAEHSLVAMHPTRAEALSICRPATLVRWSLADVAEVVEVASTPHERVLALAISPDGAMVAIVPAGAPAELRSATYLSVVAPLAAGHGAALIAFQPGGDLCAVADGEERLLLWDLRREKIAAAAFVPPRATALCFSPDGDQLAVAHSAPEGAGVSIFDTTDGLGDERADHALADERTDAAHHVESATALAYSPDGGSLAIWQTSTTTLDQRSEGWLGEVVLFDPYRGRGLWRRAIDLSTVEALEDVEGSFAGAHAPLKFCDGGALIAVGLQGLVVFLTAAEGRVAATRPSPGTLADLDVDRRRGDILVVGDQGLHRVPSPRRR